MRGWLCTACRRRPEAEAGVHGLTLAALSLPRQAALMGPSAPQVRLRPRDTGHGRRLPAPVAPLRLLHAGEPGATGWLSPVRSLQLGKHVGRGLDAAPGLKQQQQRPRCPSLVPVGGRQGAAAMRCIKCTLLHINHLPRSTWSAMSARPRWRPSSAPRTPTRQASAAAGCRLASPRCSADPPALERFRQQHF